MVDGTTGGSDGSGAYNGILDIGTESMNFKACALKQFGIGLKPKTEIKKFDSINGLIWG